MVDDVTIPHISRTGRWIERVRRRAVDWSPPNDQGKYLTRVDLERVLPSLFTGWGRRWFPFIRRLEKAGCQKEEFAQRDSEGIWRLRNSKGICFFLDPSSRTCSVYELRPVGCYIYPVNLSPEGVVAVDDACLTAGTVNSAERKKKGVLLRHQLRVIDANR
jgi:Fe-S-cluster containining protein